MPTYEYRCKDCKNEFDVFQKISDSPVKICPECGGEVKRLISAGLTPIFKGSGFYETDYKKTSREKAASTTTTPKKETPKSSKANAA